MMKQIRICLICIALLSIFSPVLSAQEAQDSTLWRIETKDGNTFAGNILAREEGYIRLDTEKFGVITIWMDNIKRMQALEELRLVDGIEWPDNPQSTRYFWSPNGYGLKKGEGYYQNVWVLFNQVSVGITDNTSIGAGLMPLFLFFGSPTPVWITPKVSIPVSPNKFNLGAGALIGTVIGADAGFFGIPYGVATLGSRDKNLNIGLGYGFAGGEWANSPTVTVSGMVRLGPKGYLLTENYYIDAGGETLLLLSAGGRTVWSSISLDYGLFVPIAEETEFFAFPWLGLSVPFEK